MKISSKITALGLSTVLLAGLFSAVNIAMEHPAPAEAASLPKNFKLISGDWEGDGRDSQATYADGVFHLVINNKPTSIAYGRNGDIPVVGDWNRDGKDEIGVFRGGDWHLRSSLSANATTKTFRYGTSRSVPFVGKWNGKNDGVGVRMGNQFHLRNSVTPGRGETVFNWGNTSMSPVAGDWNGDGRDTVGLHVRGQWFFGGTNLTRPEAGKVTYRFGTASNIPVVGDWDGNRKDTPGVGLGSTFHLRNSLTPGVAQLTRPIAYVAPITTNPVPTTPTSTPTSTPIPTPTPTTSIPTTPPPTTSTPVPTTPPPTTSTPTPIPTPTLDASPLAPGSQFHCMWSGGSGYGTTSFNSTRGEVLDKLTRAGVRSVRIDVGWDGLQPSSNSVPNANDWYVKLLDSCVNEAKARGMDVMLTLDRSPQWARPSAYANTARVLPADPKSISTVSGWLASRYAGKVSAIEVWNEPNLKDFVQVVDPAKYTAVLKASYTAIKAANPNMKVVFSGADRVAVAPGKPAVDDFYSLAYKAGAKGNYDIMGVHTYQGPADAPPDAPDEGPWRISHMPALIKLMADNKESHVPIWVTEFGWSVHDNTADAQPWNRGVTLRKHAEYTMGGFKQFEQYPQIKKAFIYSERQKATGNLHQDGYGILNRDLSPRPLYDLLKQKYVGVRYGVPAGTQLTKHSGDLVITTPGARYNALDIHGFVVVRAPDVTITNSRIRGGIKDGNRGLVTVDHADAKRFTIEDSTISPDYPSVWYDGIKGSNFTARGVDISGTVDGIKVHGNNVLIEDSRLHHSRDFASDPNQGGGSTHNDALQVLGGSNIVLRNSSLSGASNAAIQVTQDFAPVTGLVIESNSFAGGGCNVKLNHKGKATSLATVVVRYNNFDSTGTLHNGTCPLLRTNATSLTASSNYLKNGSPINIRVYG